MNDTVFRILSAAIFIIGMTLSAYHRRKADRESGGEKISLAAEGLPITIALRLLGFSFLACVFAFLIHPAWVAWARVDLPEWVRWVGVGMGVTANFLAFWVFRNLGNNISPTVVTRTNHTLVTTGPYRWVRHPLYTMGMIGFLGFALVSESWVAFLLSILVFTVMAIRTFKEEARLIDRFGEDYRLYIRRTGKFLPRLTR